MASIDNTLSVFSELSKLSLDGISIVKAGGLKLSELGKLLDVAIQIGKLVKDVPASLPELKDLDAQEAAQVGAAAFDLVKGIIVAIGSPAQAVA